MESSTVTIPLSHLLQLTEAKARAEQKVAELEAKIADLVLNPPRKPRKQSEPKERTPEELEALRIKRSEAGKKGAETKRLRKQQEAEEARLKAEDELRAQIREQIENEAAASRLQAIFTEDSETIDM
jgi:hypothetical protein